MSMWDVPAGLLGDWRFDVARAICLDQVMSAYGAGPMAMVGSP
ncbi:hypothetical protein [Rhodococcus qingshengii]|nr:hypothetical protein [Rhodococcus qingshengii]